MKKLHVEEGNWFREATVEEVVAAARSVLAARVRKGTALTSPRIASDYLAARFGERSHEVFSVLFLDAYSSDREQRFHANVNGAWCCRLE